jgi:hypothetical protein
LLIGADIVLHCIQKRLLTASAIVSEVPLPLFLRESKFSVPHLNLHAS